MEKKRRTLDEYEVILKKMKVNGGNKITGIQIEKKNIAVVVVVVVNSGHVSI